MFYISQNADEHGVYLDAGGGRREHYPMVTLSTGDSTAVEEGRTVDAIWRSFFFS